MADRKMPKINLNTKKGIYSCEEGNDKRNSWNKEKKWNWILKVKGKFFKNKFSNFFYYGY